MLPHQEKGLEEREKKAITKKMSYQTLSLCVCEFNKDPNQEMWMCIQMDMSQALWKFSEDPNQEMWMRIKMDVSRVNWLENQLDQKGKPQMAY